MENIVFGIALVLFLVVFINTIFAKINIPSIIGYILVGIITSQIFHLQSENVEILSHVSELGIVFMMFTIGLEFSFRYLLKMKGYVFGFGLAEVVIVGSIFSAILLFFGFNFQTSLILGYTFSLSSTAIIVKMLNVSGDINKQYGRKSLGILIFQDIAVIPIMLMIEIFSKKDSNITMQLLQIATSAALLIGVLYLLGRYLFDKALTRISEIGSEELFIGAILFIIFFSSSLAHFLGFSYSLGAFIAGIIIAETHFKYQVEADIAPFRDLLLGLFFIAVGMQIEPIFIIKNIHTVLLVLAGLMVIKFILIYLIIRFKAQRRTSLKVALTLMQVGEFALAVFELSKNKGLLSQDWAQIFGASVVLSMILTPFVLQNLKRLADILTTEPESEIDVQSHLKNHIIIIGYGTLGKSVAKRLRRDGVPYVIIEHDLNLVQEGIDNHEPIYLANAAKKEILEKLQVRDACSVVVTIKDFKKKRLICDILNSFKSHINIVAVAADEFEKEVLGFELDINYIVVDSEIVSKVMYEKSMKCFI